MVPIRVSVAFGGVIYYLFDGYIDSWNPSTLSGYTQYAEMSITASDAFKIFSNIDIPEDSAAGSGEDTGARITRILQSIDWYTDGEKNSIDTGNSTLQGTTWGDNALSLMQIAADSEIGQVYIGGQGQVVFNSRHALLTNSASNTVQAVFGDSPVRLKLRVPRYLTRRLTALLTIPLWLTMFRQRAWAALCSK